MIKLINYLLSQVLANLAYRVFTLQRSSSRKRKSSPCELNDLARETTRNLYHITSI